MELTTEREDGVLSLLLDGRLDGSNVSEFDEQVRAAIEDSGSVVVMDFEKLRYISSAGLRSVLMTARALGNKNLGFALCSLSEQIREVFEISGFDKIIAVHQSRADAIAALKR